MIKTSAIVVATYVPTVKYCLKLLILSQTEYHNLIDMVNLNQHGGGLTNFNRTIHLSLGYVAKCIGDGYKKALLRGLCIEQYY
ncbi:MAG: hypothetical protein KFB94_04725 [Methylophilaceae bacterium]|nr:MAG: hypothetical protein KFB94_04725 [Methylophilaceae bacterium]